MKAAEKIEDMAFDCGPRAAVVGPRVVAVGSAGVLFRRGSEAVILRPRFDCVYAAVVVVVVAVVILVVVVVAVVAAVVAAVIVVVVVAPCSPSVCHLQGTASDGTRTVWVAVFVL